MDHFRPFADKLPGIVLHLLKDTPSSSVSVRKELIVATRHFLSSDTRAAFVPQVSVGVGVFC
jgi:transformation/transcription domain-associated protein